MDQPKKPHKCSKPTCKCGSVRRIMNICIQNNGDENCLPFKDAYQQCLDHYKAIFATADQNIPQIQ